MNILISKNLIHQTKKKRISKQTVNKIFQELENLAVLEKVGENDLLTYYLKNQNGKKLKGAEHIFKYRLSDGDRILYTYGKYLENVREPEKEKH